MSVRVRLTRVGSRKNPIWRVVVADQRSPRDGRFIEMIGRYNPQTEPSTITIDDERLRYWLARGAQPTSTVKQLLKAQGKGGGATAVAEPAAAREPSESEAGEARPAAPEPGPDEAAGSGPDDAPEPGPDEAPEPGS
jgi:small subunit ribosomal protein S16